MKNKSFLSFLFGDISTTAFFLIYTGDWGHELIKIGSALMIGILGGVGGLLGKDLYALIKSFIIKNKVIMKSWILKNKVLLSALLGAVVLTLQQAMANHSTDWKAIGYAAFIALLGVVAKNLKGAGWTVTGIVGTVAGVFYDLLTTGTFTWNELILSVLLALTTAAVGHIGAEDQQPSIPYNARM